MRGNYIYLPYFCRRLFQIWASGPFDNSNHTITNSAQIIWNNNKIKYRGSVLFLNRWIKRDILFVSDIIDDTGHLSYETITDRIPDSPLTKFEFNVVKNAFNNIQIHDVYRERDTNLYIRNKLISEWKTKDIRIMFQNMKSEIKKEFYLDI